MKKEKTDNISQALKTIAGTEIHSMFGEPFTSAFKATYSTGSNEEITVAAYTCSLFLSTILEGFPSDRLHTFIRYTKECYNRFSFDCRMYDPLIECAGENSLKRVALINSEGSTIFRECSREEIKEAFDFYTNR